MFDCVIQFLPWQLVYDLAAAGLKQMALRANGMDESKHRARKGDEILQ